MASAKSFPRRQEGRVYLDVWGGCCGTWSNHLNEIAKNVITA